MNASRRARVERTTKESEIVVELNLDGTGDVHVDTGVPFYDHMLHARPAVLCALWRAGSPAAHHDRG